MFTLRNPTQEALSQAGANFGGGLGQSLLHFAQQKALARGLKGITPESNPYDIIRQFAENNVPAHLTEQFFSPVVQQRAAQQQAAKIYGDVLNNPNATPKDIANAALRAGAITGSNQGVEQALQIAMGQMLAAGSAQPGTTGTGITPSSNGAGPAGRQVKTDEYQPQPAIGKTGIMGVPGMSQVLRGGGTGGIQQAGIGGQEAFEQFPANIETKPFTAAEEEAIRRQYRSQFPLNVADAEANRIIEQRKRQSENEAAEFERQRNLNEDQRLRQQEVKNKVTENFARDFGGNEFVNTNLKDFATKYAIETAKGDADQRWNQTRNKIDQIVTARDTLNKKHPSSDYLASLDNEGKKKRLERLNVDTKAFLNHFPPEYKTIGYDMLRSDLRDKIGIGPVSAEYAINYPHSSTIKRINSLGDIRENLGRYRRGSEAYEKATEKTTHDLSNILFDTLKDGESPLVLKDLVVNGLRYSDDVFDNAMNEAEKKMQEKGFAIPDYNRTARNDTKKKFRTANPFDIFGGQSLLGPTEFYR